MTGAEIAEAIAKASRGIVRALPTGEDREVAVVIQNIAIVLVRELRSGSIGVSVLAMRAWNLSRDEDPTKVIRESAHLAHEWISAHPNGVTALDVALEAAARIEKSRGFPVVLRTPGGQPAPTEMWLGDLGIFQQEDSVRVAGCRILKSRDQLSGVCEKMVELTQAGTAMADTLAQVAPQLKAMTEALAANLTRVAPPPEGAWQSVREHDDEFNVAVGDYERRRRAVAIRWKQGVISATAGLKGDRGFSIARFDPARDFDAVANAVRTQLSVLHAVDVKPGDRFRVLQAFQDDSKVAVSPGEILKFVERLEEDHQPDASYFERESLPGRQRILITDIWEIGSAIDKYLTRL